ncbi:hypothetical protein G9A89_001048 [Geosiphon pyriformis]|nr:hypothetical protein G9A89_001048 [Geosiphon pyriformis]
MTQFTPFELVYGRKATLPIERVILSYPTKTINEENFEATLYQRTYQLIETLENNRRTAADNIKQPMEFKIGDQVLLHHTKAEKQWSGKFDPKWDGLFHIHKALGNRAYKLRLEDRILKKVAHGNWLKIYHAEGGKEGDKEREKSYKRRYLVSKLEKIKEALTCGTKLPKTEEWTPDNAQE